MTTAEELTFLQSRPPDRPARRYSELSTHVKDISQFYEIKHVLGQGMSAVVFKARRRSDCSMHAVKVCVEESVSTPTTMMMTNSLFCVTGY